MYEKLAMNEENIAIHDSYKIALKCYMDDQLEKSLKITKWKNL